MTRTEATMQGAHLKNETLVAAVPEGVEQARAVVLAVWVLFKKAAQQFHL